MEGEQGNNLLKALEQSQDVPTQAELRMIERCNQIALGSLSGGLKAMLEKAMDEFIAQADKPGERAMQDLYLQSVTLIREKSTHIEESFRNHLFDAFQAAIHPRKTPSKKKQSDDEFDLDQFSLVDPDELEESIATREMVAKIEGSCKEELTGLQKRMALLLHDAEFERYKNPFAPEVLAEAYMAACRDTEAPIKVRLLFVHMWDRHMQNAVVSAFHEMNQYLIEKDVLPKIRREARRSGGTSAEEIAAIAAQAAVEAVQAVQSEGDVYGAMQKMLSAAASRGDVNLAAASAAVAHNPAILAQLSQLQHQPVEGAQAMAMPDGGFAPVAVLRDLKDSALGDNMGHADAMTIEIVAMLFDYIFEDKQVPDGIKALIGRLQIPVLKAAMLDQAFFSKRNHPTRRLLNVLGEAASGWDKALNNESPAYQKVEAIVQKILDVFEDNLDVFEEVIADFEQFMAEQEKEADALIQAAAPLIVEKEKLVIAQEEANEAAEDAVRVRANDPDLPQVVRDFLCQTWSAALSTAYLTGGTESATWLEAVSTMDDLIWSVRPKTTKEGRDQLVKILPSLLRRMNSGLERAKTEKSVRDQFMSQLVKCHAASVSTSQQAKEAAEAAPQKETAVVLQFPKAPAIAEKEVKLEIITPSPTNNGLDVEEITIGSVGWVEDEELEANASDEAEANAVEIDEEMAREIVSALKPGMLVEFRHSGMEPMQAKLKWISPLKGAYLFADRQGKRAATMPRDKLEAAFRIGSAKILDEAPLLDRAVDNVIETLKQAAA